MDFRELKQRLSTFAGKYKYAALILLLGVLLMNFPTPPNYENKQETNAVPQQLQLDDKLSLTLSQIEGAGKVCVLLSEAEGECILYQTNETLQNDSSRLETVVITDSSRTQQGLIMQKNPPKYQGAIVICQGAKNASVKLAVTEAVANITGLTFDHISVLSMK